VGLASGDRTVTEAPASQPTVPSSYDESMRVGDEARNVAQDLGLPPWWLNEQASV
jgi:hypothetical protein